MSGFLFTNPALQVFDADGHPIPFARLFAYQAGTSTPLDTYGDASLDDAAKHDWPVEADAHGRFPPIFLGPHNYTIRLTTSAGAEVWTRQAINPQRAVSGEGAWPVGAIYTSVLGTNPTDTFGFGTWVPFGPGRVLIGVDVSQPEFDAVEKTGGAKTHVLTVDELPPHTHAQEAHAHEVTDPGHGHAVTDPGHDHPVTDPEHDHDYDQVDAGATLQVAVGTGAQVAAGTTGSAPTGVTVDSAPTGLSVQSASTGITVAPATPATTATGGGQAHPTLPPYITAYRWKRVA